MKWLKDRLVKRRVEKLLLHYEKRAVDIPEKIKTIGILASSEVEFEAIKGHIRNIWGYKVRIGGYYYSDKKEMSIDGFNHSHFNLNGSPSDYFNAFLEEDWNLLFVPSLKLNNYIRYLLLLKKSRLSMGFFSEDTKPFLDLMLEYEEKDIHENIQYLIHYLNKIKKAC